MRDNRSQFFSLLLFIVTVALVVSNGFMARIFAQSEQPDVYREVQPIGDVLDEILKNYVEDPAVGDVVEGAIIGMMNSLDDHSSYIPKKALQQMTEDTDGEFDGIGVSIMLSEEGYVSVFQPIPGSPAAQVGVLTGDIIYQINDISAKGMSLDEARDLIRGPRGTIVHLTIWRRYEGEDKDSEMLEFDIKRGKIPLESLVESRIIDGSVGYIRVSDFKKTTAEELAAKIEEFKGLGMKSLILDLRWNPGGLLNAAPEASELFLEKGSLVTYTKSRSSLDGTLTESMRLSTERKPVLPQEFPVIVLVNENTASSSEIVTGALQFHQRAIVVGVKTFGKGSVQTIIPLARPEGSAIRLTTALYYTPAEVSINKQGILPDVEVPMSEEDSRKLWLQLLTSYQDDPNRRNEQNHGAPTGDEPSEDIVDDIQLAKALEILREDTVFAKLIEKYHQSTDVTQKHENGNGELVAGGGESDPAEPVPAESAIPELAPADPAPAESAPAEPALP